MLDRIDPFMRRLAATIAIIGGLALLTVVMTTVVSIIGRALIPLGLSPIRGDFELIELGVGLAIFAFLPWAQITRQHAVVEILTLQFSDRVNRYIDLVSDLLMFAIAVLICWRHFLGMLDKQRYGETTFILQYPVWWAYAAGLVGALTFVIISAYCVALSIEAVRTGVNRQPPLEADH